MKDKCVSCGVETPYDKTKMVRREVIRRYIWQRL